MKKKNVTSAYHSRGDDARQGDNLFRRWTRALFERCARMSFVTSALLRVSEDIKRNRRRRRRRTRRERERERERKERSRRLRSLLCASKKNKKTAARICTKEKRTVGPALATINTVSPLGTALTVPRSHPVTGMMLDCACFFLPCFFFLRVVAFFLPRGQESFCLDVANTRAREREREGEGDVF
jgi:hypothetical protein